MAVTSRDSTERICSRGAVPRSEARTNAKEAEVNNAKSGAIDRDFLKTSGDKNPHHRGVANLVFLLLLRYYFLQLIWGQGQGWSLNFSTSNSSVNLF